VIRHYIALLLILLTSLSGGTIALADNVGSSQYSPSLITQYLASAKRENSLLAEQVKQYREARAKDWKGIMPKTVDVKVVDRFRVRMQVAQETLAGVIDKQQELQRRLAQLSERQSSLLATLRNVKVTDDNNDKVKRQEKKLKYRLSLINRKIELNKEWLSELAKTQNHMNQLRVISDEYLSALQDRFAVQREKARLHDLQAARVMSEREQKALLLDIQKYQNELKRLPQNAHTTERALTLSMKIQFARKRIAVSELNFAINELRARVNPFVDAISGNMPISHLTEVSRRFAPLRAEIDGLRKRIIEQQKGLAAHTETLLASVKVNSITEDAIDAYKREIAGISKSFNVLKTRIDAIAKRLGEHSKAVQKALRGHYTKRNGLFTFQAAVWQELQEKLVDIPSLAYEKTKILFNHIAVGAGYLTQTQFLFYCLIGLVILGAALPLTRYLEQANKRLWEKRGRVSINLGYGLSQFMLENMAVLIGFVLFMWTVLYCGVPYTAYRMFLYLFFLWFSLRLTVSIARLSLVETMQNVEGRDVKLYRRLKWTVAIGGVIGAFAIVVHQLFNQYVILDLSNRLLMLFFLVLGFFLFYAWRVFPSLVSDTYRAERPYVYRATVILSILVPISLTSTAIVGLLGYMDVAYSLSTYQVLFLLIITAYVILRGVIIDTFDLLADVVVRRTKNGWLLYEAFIKPVDRILRLLLLLTTIIALYMSYGWTDQKAAFVYIKEILTTPYYTNETGAVSISILSSVYFVLLWAVVIWAARWTREFSYRWFFSRVRDKATRNSLSIFLQYTVVVIIAVLTLRVLGIDLTGLTFILSALALGLGFGLRDVANNLVSGVFLLMERTVREGDLISVAEFEGRVTNIGVRALTITTWDQLEVIIPNAETFNKAFTNWTHQDSIVRTVLNIKVQRSDSPHRVHAIIIDVLEHAEAILTDPPPQVFLRELANDLVEFEVRYFINLEEHMRVAVKSQILFAIWDAFMEHGIKPPYPVQDINVRTLPPLPEPSS